VADKLHAVTQPAIDNLSAPLLRMGSFFLGDTLPQVASARDIYARGQDLVTRGISATPSEAQFLRGVTWCMLQIQHDQEESELHSALARVAALALAIIEDDDFTIPPGYSIGSRTDLENFAIRLRAENFQLNMSLGVTVGSYDLSFTSVEGLTATAERLPADDLRTKTINQILIHLRQGEELHQRQQDPERAQAHEQRLHKAYERARFLLARLLSVPTERDNEVLRAHLVRRELKHIEIDALGALRITEAEQVTQAKQLLAWTEVDLGEELTDENKAALAARLAEVADEENEDSGWLFEMD
jgi:hypothetical protein